MSKLMETYTFTFRKYSVLRMDDILNDLNNSTQSMSQVSEHWYHYPQRSDLSINFIYFPKTSMTVVTIFWKGSTMDRITIDPTNQDIISWVARYPSVGFKLSDKGGKLKQRFQVSFGSKDDFDQCCSTIRGKLHLPLTMRETPTDNLANMLTQESSQVPKKFSKAFDTPSPLNQLYMLPKTNQYSINQNIAQSQAASRIETNRQAHTDPTFPEMEYSLNDTSASQIEDLSRSLLLYQNYYQQGQSQPPFNATVPYIDPLKQISLAHNISPNIDESSLFIGDQLPNSHYTTLTQPDNYYASQTMLKSLQTLNKSNELTSIRDSSIPFFSLQDLKDEKLRELVIEKLKDKEFVDFVIRLDGIIHETSK